MEEPNDGHQQSIKGNAIANIIDGACDDAKESNQRINNALNGSYVYIGAFGFGRRCSLHLIVYFFGNTFF
jgi:hypothetical protein